MSNRIIFKKDYAFRCSNKFLFYYLAQPSGLSEWVADSVEFDHEHNEYVFYWDGEANLARLDEQKLNHFIRFNWDSTENEYIEFKLIEDTLNNEWSLEVTDFCDHDDFKETEQLWDISVAKLREVIGA